MFLNEYLINWEVGVFVLRIKNLNVGVQKAVNNTHQFDEFFPTSFLSVSVTFK